MLNNENFTERAYRAMQKAGDEAEENSHPQIAPAHVAYVLLSGYDDEDGDDGPALYKQVVEKAGGDPEAMSRYLKKCIVRMPAQHPAPKEVSVSPALTDVTVAAYKLSKKQKDSFISIYHLMSTLSTDRTIEQALKESGVPNTSKIDEAVAAMRGSKKIDSQSADSANVGKWLKKFTVDMTALARDGKIDPVIGREEEMRRVIRILSRRMKNNPVLVGEPGVGKTTVVEGLARRIVNSDVPASLAKCKLLSLDLGSLIAGASYHGEFEERIKGVLKEIEDSEITIILFIDEIHMLMGAGRSGSGAMDAANLLKPMLARGQLHCIGATTLAEYQKYIERDSAFERRFQQVMVPEPTVPETISILRGLKERYEVHHGVNILDSAIVSAATLAARYLTTRRLPDSAVDLIDEAAASVRVNLDSQPEALDLLERRHRQLQIEIHALEREKDKESKLRLEAAKKEADAAEAELKPLREKYTKEKQRTQEIQDAKIKLESLKVRLDSATRSGDTMKASDLAYYAIPDVEKRIHALERAKAKADAEAHDKSGGEHNSLVVDAVGPDQINEIVGRWTGIPVTRLKTTEKDKLLRMEQVLSKKVVGQKEAVRSVSNAIRLQRSGLSNPNSPPSFLFCGASGTGKTHLTKALAEFLFDDPNAMIRFDMSEYQERHSVSRMIGAPPGYVGHDEGGQLTDNLRRRPFSILLFDEVEKAAKEVLTVLLQLMDDGRITDSRGRVIDAKNCIIVMTSNLGAEYLQRPSLSNGSVDPETRELIMGALQAHFLPEFLNRISSTVIFNRLPRREIRKIVDIRLAEIQKRLDDNGRRVKIMCSPEVRDYLGKAGYSPAYGARPLSRLIDKEILNNLAVYILRGSIRDGEVARMVMKNGQIAIIPNHKEEIPADTSSDSEEYDTEDDDDEEMDVDEK